MPRFDLDVAIAAWRRAYEYTPGITARGLDELEWHLRDHTTHLIAEGHTPEHAFRLATQELGDYRTADTEYRKVEHIRARRHPIRHLLLRLSMLRHHFVLAVRTMRKNTLVASINIFGLALGLACALLVLMYAQDEWAYDHFHTNGDRIVRISTVLTDGVDESEIATNGWPLGRVIAEESPDVAHMLYMRSWAPAIALDGNRTYHTLRYADATFFDLFSFRLLDGDPATALAAPYSIVLTEDLADRYFGRQDVVGESIVLNDTLDFMVTGVVENVPEHSHMRFEGLVSFETQLRFNPAMSDRVGWFSLQMTNYAMLNPGVSPEAFESRIADTYMRHAAENFTNLGYEAKVAVEPLSDLYLHSEFGNMFGPQGNGSTVLLMRPVGYLR
ncbi:MAG: ABC transporter permease [Bacteroidota bacterium]